MTAVKYPTKCSDCGSNSFTPAGEPKGVPVNLTNGLQAQAFSCDNCGTLVFKQFNNK